ncbi:hypothetical protein [Bacillus sp. D386]|uniref:hypothetical protein n=1 Tax=Bacillus sp. D386 TaxID=2587155 RepID=UPI0011222976|nr:hypothetical protein [Bacillus sp. D386]
MNLALVILFSTAVVLLLISFMKMKKQTKEEKKQLDSYYAVMLDETNKLQEQINKLELNAEVTAQEAGIMGHHSEERQVMVKMLDLYKRGYSTKSIASMHKLTENEVVELLAPYEGPSQRRRKIANDA